MPVRKTPRRQRREYEREWNSYCVDKNLEDEWLIRLNDLEAFRLISICMGHSGCQTELAKAAPHIKPKPKERLLPGIARCWDENKSFTIWVSLSLGTMHSQPMGIYIAVSASSLSESMAS
jgi:hypothetical protein